MVGASRLLKIWSDILLEVWIVWITLQISSPGSILRWGVSIQGLRSYSAWSPDRLDHSASFLSFRFSWGVSIQGLRSHLVRGLDHSTTPPPPSPPFAIRELLVFKVWGLDRLDHSTKFPSFRYTGVVSIQVWGLRYGSSGDQIWDVPSLYSSEVLVSKFEVRTNDWFLVLVRTAYAVRQINL